MKTIQQLIEEHSQIIAQLDKEGFNRIIKEWLKQKRPILMDYASEAKRNWINEFLGELNKK